VEAYDGPQIVGMDLHRRRSVLVRMTGDGRKLGTARIANSPARLAAEIRRAGLHPEVVLEACYGWYWAADVLAAAGAEVHLAHPAGVRAFSHRRVKNDELDARDLADLLRMGRLAEAWIAPAEIRELREVTRYRGKLVQLRTSCKDQVHGVVAKLGVEVTCSDIFGAWGTRWLDELPLPQPYCWKVASLRQLIGWLTAEITVLEQVTGELLAGHEDRTELEVATDSQQLLVIRKTPCSRSKSSQLSPRTSPRRRPMDEQQDKRRVQAVAASGWPEGQRLTGRPRLLPGRTLRRQEGQPGDIA
jgi:hypothetical protein